MAVDELVELILRQWHEGWPGESGEDFAQTLADTLRACPDVVLRALGLVPMSDEKLLWRVDPFPSQES